MAFKVCCSCGEANITIRRYDTDTGETLWEYGPGEGWTPHYGSDLITGWYVPANTVLNRRVQTVGSGTWIRPGLTEYIRPRATINAVWANRTVTNINENILQPADGNGNTCSPVLPLSGAPDTQTQQWTLRNFLQTGSITSVTLWMRVRFDSNSDGTIDSARVRLNGTWYTGSVVNLPSSGAWGWASMTITTAFGSISINTLPAFEITAGLSTADATLELDTAYLEARIVGASAGLSPNAAEALHWVTLNAEDGSVVNDILVPGAFVTGIQKGNYRPENFFPTELYGLTNGNIVTAGGPAPLLELVDFQDNNATKYYTLHGHSYKLGNVGFVTRGGASCGFAVTATNATIEAAIDALTEVSSVTVTGGPWPHKRVDITIVWTAFSGDFAAFSYENTSGGKLTRAGATLFDAETGEIIGAINAQSFGFGTGVTASKLISTGNDDVPTVTSAPSTAINGIAGACGSNAILIFTLGTLENWTPGETWTRNWVLWLNIPNSSDDITPTFGSISNIENDTVLIGYACTNNQGLFNFASPSSGKYNTLGKYGTFVNTNSGGVTDLPSANYGDGALLHTLGFRSSWYAQLPDGDGESALCVYGESSLRNIAYLGTTVDATNANFNKNDNYAISAGHTVTLNILPSVAPPDDYPGLYEDGNEFAYQFSRINTLFAATSDKMLVRQASDPAANDSMVMRWLGRTENVETTNPLATWYRTYRRYWWTYQVRYASRAVSGEFRMKIKWTFSPDSFIYTNWMSYTSTTETELEDELTETLGPPGSNYNRTPPFGNFPIVSVQPLVGSQYNDWGIGNEADPDRNWYSILERGILVVYTTDRFGTDDLDSDTYIPSEKASAFSNQANIVFEFRNMVWPDGYDDTLQMVERTSAADLIWSRKWIPRPKAPNRASGSWIKDGRTIHYNTESRAELPPP